MTRRSKREIENCLDRLEGGDDGPGDVEVTSEVVEITETDVDENGTVDGLAHEPPEGAVAAELDTGSDAVGAYLVWSDGRGVS